MGRPIVYCAGCGKSLPEAEFEKGRASMVEDRPYCATCRPPAATPGSSRVPAAPAVKTSTGRIPVSPSSTRRSARPPSRAPFAAGIAGGAALLLVVVAVLASSRGAPPPRPPAAPPAAPPPPVLAPKPEERAREADVERAMREEAARAQARKLDEFLAAIRKMADDDPLGRKDEIASMLESAAKTAGGRAGEVERLRAEVATKTEEARKQAALAARWTLDEAAGTAAADRTGRHPGALEKGAAWTSGKLGAAVSFDGIQGGVRVVSAPGLSPHAGPTGEMTLACWIRIPELPAPAGQGRTPPVSKGAVASYEYALYVYADGTPAFALWTPGGEDHAHVAGGRVAVGRWHHLAGTYRQGAFARFYLDGRRLAQSTALQHRTAAGSAPLYIGRRADGQFFKGEVDDVRLYSRVLEDAEVRDLAEGRE